MNKRIGLLGGSFDPPHVGHLVMAERACEALSLARVDFLVSGQSAHKSGKQHVSPAAARLQMARLAAAGNAMLGVDERETRRAGPSYTIDSARELIKERPGERPLFVLGGDMLADLPSWKDVVELLTLADFAPVFRPGFVRETLKGLEKKLGKDVVARLEAGVVKMPLLDVSSREIRARIKAGKSVRYLVPDAVLAFIERERLYRG